MLLLDDDRMLTKAADDDLPSAVTWPDEVSSKVLDAVSRRAGLTPIGTLAWMLGLIEPE